MKNKLFALLSGAICSLAAFVAVNSLNTLCFAKFYQPPMPEGLENFKKSLDK